MKKTWTVTIHEELSGIEADTADEANEIAANLLLQMLNNEATPTSAVSEEN